jgi:hypothetical protein
MALYRFLFAPVLLAIAVLIGTPDRAATEAARSRPAAPARADAEPVAPAASPPSARAASAPAVR